jgi:histidinol phosphatase-like PHP family hydrolase
VATLALKLGAKLVLNNDAHGCDDLVYETDARRILTAAGIKKAYIQDILGNSIAFARRKS